MTRYNMLTLGILAILLVGCGASSEAQFERRVSESVRATVQVIAEQAYQPSAQEQPTVVATSMPSAGMSRQHPVPLGEIGVAPSGGGLFEVRVSDVVRGDKAKLLMQQANSGIMSSASSRDGMEWMLVRMKGKCLDDGGDAGAYFGNGDNMVVYSLGRAVRQSTMFTSAPAPQLFAKYISGANLDGWVALEVHPDEQQPLLFMPSAEYSDEGTWFALSE